MARGDVDAAQRFVSTYGVRGVPTPVPFADVEQVGGFGVRDGDGLRPSIGR